MRVAIIVFVALSAMGGAAYFASKQLIVEQKPPPPRPLYRVTAALPGAGLEDSEKEVAGPLEEQLAAVQGVTRIRTRITAGGVELDVWADSLTPAPRLKTETLPRELLPPTVLRLDERAEANWIVRGEKRPEVYGAVCGVEDPVVTVVLDPPKLAVLHLTPLDVERVLKPGTPEELAGLEVAPQVKLRDVAVIETARPKPSCSATVGGQPAWLVTTREREVKGGEKLGPFSRVVVRGAAPNEPSSVKPAVTTSTGDGEQTWWFSPPLSALQRDGLLAELKKLPELEVRYVDGLERVRLVLMGVDRSLLHGIAGTVVDTLKHAKGVKLVVPPLEPRPQVNVKVDREKASLLGIPAADIASLVALAMKGREHGGVRITVPLAEPEHLGALMIGDRRLADVVTMTRELEPVELTRQDREPSIEIVAYGIDRKGVPMPALPGGVRLEIYEEL